MRAKQAVVKQKSAWLKVALLVAAYATVFFTLDLLRHFSYTQNSNDVAVFDQSLWWVLHGKGFYNSLEGVSHFAVHNSPILFFLLPFYALLPSPVMLIFCQVAASALAIIPAFLLGRHVIGERAGLGFALILALYHPLHGVSWDLLNELAYVVAPLLLAFYGLASEQWLILWMGSILAAMCKEEIGFVVGFLGIYAVFAGLKKSSKNLAAHGVCLFLLGMGWSFFSLYFIIPHFRHAPYQYFNIENRYVSFGSSMGSILLHMAEHPGLALQTAFTPPKIFYCIELLLPLAFVSLLAPAILLIATPIFAANLLSSSSMMSMVGARYPAAIIPFVFASAIYGAKKIMDRSSNPDKTLNRILKTQIVLAILCTLLLSSNPLRLRIVHIGNFPVPGFKVPLITRHDLMAKKIIHEIPPGSVVSAQPNFTGHIPHGCIVSPFFRKDAQFILLDPSFPQWYRDSGMSPTEILRKGYKLLESENGILLFGKR